MKLLHHARWPDTSALFARIGIQPGMKCLDVGCGGGEVTFEIARLVGPDGHVTGIDMDEIKLDLARGAAAEKGLSNVEFQAEDVNDWNGTDGYDFVFCRFLLEHLSRPLDLIRRMWGAVNPGGVLAVEDADFGGLFCEPANEGYEFYARMFPRVLTRRGGDGGAGSKLYRYFLEAGIPDPGLKLVQRADSAEQKHLTVSTLEAIADGIVDEGLATQDEVRAAIANLAESANDSTTIMGGPRIFQVWARRRS